MPLIVGNHALKKDVDYVMPEWYGAKGDGNATDTTAIQEALDTGKNVVFDGAKTYKTDTLNLQSNSKVFGNGAKFRCVSKYLFNLQNVQNVDVISIGNLKENNYTFSNGMTATIDAWNKGLITVVNCRNINIVDCTIDSIDTNGISITKSKNVTINANTIRNIKSIGIIIYDDCNNIDITKNNLQNTVQNGIYIKGGVSGIHGATSKTNVDIINVIENTVDGVFYHTANTEGGLGIELHTDVINTNVISNKVSNCYYMGISVPNGRGKVIDNVISNIKGHANSISLEIGTQCICNKNTISMSSRYGISCRHTKNTRITNNDIIEDGTFTTNSTTAIAVENSENLDITSNNIENHTTTNVQRHGIQVQGNGTKKANIENNTTQNGYSSFYIVSGTNTSDVKVMNNIFSSNIFTLFVQSCTNLLISKNIVRSAGNACISSDNVTSLKIFDNMLINTSVSNHVCCLVFANNTNNVITNNDMYSENGNVIDVRNSLVIISDNMIRKGGINVNTGSVPTAFAKGNNVRFTNIPTTGIWNVSEQGLFADPSAQNSIGFVCTQTSPLTFKKIGTLV